MPRRAQLVDRQPRRDRSQVGGWRLDLGTGLPGAFITQERLLDDVLGVGDAAEHAVGEQDQLPPQPDRVEVRVHVPHLPLADDVGGMVVTNDVLNRSGKVAGSDA